MPITTHVLYRDILKKAFYITWRNRFLWIFGFFASFLSLGGANEMVLKNSLRQFSAVDQLSAWSFFGVTMGPMNLLPVKDIWFLALAIIFCAILVVAFFYLAVVGLASLVRAANLLDRGRKTGFLINFIEGKKFFWRLAAISVMGKALIVLFLLIIGGLISLIVTENTFFGAILYFLSFLVLATVSITVSFLIVYASIYTVLKSGGIIENIERAWQLFKDNWVVTVEAAIILFFVNLVAKFGIMILLVISALPLMILLMAGYFLAASFMPVITLSVWMILAIAILLLAGSIFSAYQMVVWTLLFDKIAKGRILSKLHRIFR